MAPLLQFTAGEVDRKEKYPCRYVVRTLDADEVNDPLQPARWRRQALRCLPVLKMVAQLLAVRYAFVQFNSIWATQGAGHQLSAVPGLLLLALPLYNILVSLMEFLSALTYSSALFRQWRPVYRLCGQEVPRVNVIITVCNEAIDVVQDTILATASIDYPRERLRIIVADDGGSQSLRQWIEGQRTFHDNIWYTSRAKEDRSGYKAGNLNHAMRFARGFPDGAAKFIACLDADMIPEKHWLRHVVPHLLQDTSVGCACPAQLFYNFPENDPLMQSQHAEFRGLDVLRDLAGNGWNTGSGWVCRREALERIGGFPTASLIEDVYSSFLMFHEGYKTVYVPEALQYGLMPDTLYGHVKQFTRWHIGGVQLGLQMGFFLNSRLTGNMDILQRLQAFVWTARNAMLPISTLLIFVLGPIWMFSNFPLEPMVTSDNLIHLLRLRCVSVLLDWAAEILLSFAVGYQAAVRAKAVHTWLYPHFSMAMIRYWLLPRGLGGKATRFTPSGSICKVIDERNAELRPGLYLRIKTILLQSGTWPNLLLVVLICVGAMFRLRSLQNAYPSGIPSELLLLYLLWPPIPWFQAVIASLIPLQYTLWPPDVKDRGKLMEKRIPRISAKEQRFQWLGWRYSFLYTLTMLFTAAILVCTLRGPAVKMNISPIMDN